MNLVLYKILHTAPLLASTIKELKDFIRADGIEQIILFPMKKGLKSKFGLLSTEI